MATGTDIFGYKRQKPRGVFSSDLATLNISGTTLKGALVQNWNFQYSHDVQEIYEIGSSNLYWVKGHPIGQGQLGRIIGADKANLKFFSDKAYDSCQGGDDMTIKMKPGMCDAATNTDSTAQEVTVKLIGCIVTSIGFAIQAADVKIMEDIRIRFASLEID
jgi:hypothetical protein